MTFIQKPGRPHYTKAKAYHPLNQLVDRPYKGWYSERYNWHQNEIAYQLVLKLHFTSGNTHWKCDERKEIAIGALPDTEGAFDKPDLKQQQKLLKDIQGEFVLCRKAGT
jgi:hypothetical protein